LTLTEIKRSKQCKCEVFMMGKIFATEKEMRHLIADINIKIPSC